MCTCPFSTAYFNKDQPVDYNILMNPGSASAMVRPAGRDLRLTVTSLEPFTSYLIRVQACQRGNIVQDFFFVF